MLSLPHGCHVGKISVHPTGWELPGASTQADWYIHYRFHDPNFAGKYPKGYLKILKGMNDEKGLVKRRSITRDLIKNEATKLEEGYNPILNKVIAPAQEQHEIHPTTDFASALQAAYKLLPDIATKREIRLALVHIKEAIAGLGYASVKISEVRKKHIKAILRKIGLNKKAASADPTYEWGASSFNHYRSYLKMLFDQLEEAEATETDPVSKIKKRKEVKKIRQILTVVERNRVDAYLRFYYHELWRFTHIFFHSGARIAEMTRVRLEDVDIKNQRFKITVRKGRQFVQVWKTIKDLAVPFWEEVLREARPGDYIFSRELRPGPHQIRKEQITHRWSTHVKKDLRITADFYSLKYLNTTQTVSLRGDKAAAAQNSHTSTAMVVSIYDVERAGREHEELKTVNNPLA